MKVRYGEGVATHTGPESCAVRREAAREALTGECVGQVLSGVRQVRGADVFRPTEGNTGGSLSRGSVATPRRRRPWHAQKPSAREPGDLHRRPRQSVAGTASGRPEAVADDEREGEVGPAR